MEQSNYLLNEISDDSQRLFCRGNAVIFRLPSSAGEADTLVAVELKNWVVQAEEKEVKSIFLAFFGEVQIGYVTVVLVNIHADS